MKKREDLIEEITKEFKREIKENIYDMTQKELTMANRLNKLLISFEKLTFIIPHEKIRLNSIIKSFHFNLRQCYHYLFYPSNKAYHLMIRIVLENLIIVKFLLDNDESYTENWYYWEDLLMLDKIKKINYLDNDILEKSDENFARWKDKVINEISTIYGEDKLNNILNNKYGWAYPSHLKVLSLSSISKSCGGNLAYNLFSYNSSFVHSNTYNLQNDVSRLDYHTFDIARSIVDAIELIITFLYDYVIKDNVFKDFVKRLNLAYDYQHTYHENLLDFLIENKT